MNDHLSTLILLDPSSPDGEAGLLVARNSEARVTVMIFTDDPSGASLAAFADAESVSISHAAGRYLDQVVARCAPEHIEVVSSSGVDPVDEILEIAGETQASSIIIPPSRPGLGGRSWDRLVAASTVPIVLAPRIAA